MTISLIHYNPETGLSASITATGGVSVGGYVNHSWRGIGCCATQGLLTNPWYADKAKKLLLQGLNCQAVITTLKQQDLNFQQRQCMIMDKFGHTSFINGNENIPYSGSAAFPHIAVAGNMLESEVVLDRFIECFICAICTNAQGVLQKGELPDYQDDYEKALPETLINALEMALAAGGDKRGAYSAALRVESMTRAPIDIRVDWSDSTLIQDMRAVLTRVRDASFADFLVNLPNQ